MRIGILQAGHVPEDLRSSNGDYDAMFARLLDGHAIRADGADRSPFEYRAFNVEAGEFPEESAVSPENSGAGVDGWLVTGSRHGVYEGHPWIAPLEELVRRIHASGRPLVGVCFGHQLVAQALGGKVEKFGGGWSVGRQAYRIEGEDTWLMAWHQDQVVEPPQGARVVGSSDFCEIAAMAVGDSTWTIQPHPEFDPGYVEGLIDARGRGIVPDALLDEARAGLGEPLDTARTGRRMARHFLSAPGSPNSPDSPRNPDERGAERR